jgi:hypothetical protein
VEFAVPLDGVDEPGIFAEVVRDAMCTEKATTAPMEVKRALQALLDTYSEQLQRRAQTMAAALASQAQNSNTVATPAQPGQTGA